jgi:hypothetical protein
MFKTVVLNKQAEKVLSEAEVYALNIYLHIEAGELKPYKYENRMFVDVSDKFAVVTYLSEGGV